MKFFLLLFSSLIAITNFAQKQKPQYFIYDKDWNSAKDVGSAAYVVQATSIGDSIFINRIFKGTGKLWKQESFSDAEQTNPNGHFAWYDEEGRVDSSGYVKNKLKNKTWSYYDDTLGIYLSVEYDNGHEIERRDYLRKVIITANGEKTFDEEKRERDSSSAQTKNFVVEEKEAVFKGGPQGYKKYLEKNLNPPSNIARTGTVNLQFIINKSGKIEDLLIRRSVQLSVDIEAIRVLSEMPDWTPAFQNGKNVYYQCLQSITFQAN